MFIHAEACPGFDPPERYPPGYRSGPMMIFRPYHFNGRMAYSALAMVDGDQAEQTITRMFTDPTIASIHARNRYAGCFMFAIYRPA